MANAKKNNTPDPVATLAEARAQLADAHSLLAKREDEFAQVEDAGIALKQRLQQGDDSVTALELATGDLAVERAKLLIGAARKAVQAAERAADLAEAQAYPTLAQWLHEIVKDNVFEFGLFGFPISVVPQLPAEPAVPAVYLFQSEATRADLSTGILAGSVHMSVVVPEGAPFDGNMVRNALARLIDQKGIARVEANLSQHNNGCQLRIKLSDVKPEIPVISPEVPSSNKIAEVAFKVSEAMVIGGGQRTVQDRWVGNMMTGMNAGVGAIVNNIHVYVPSHELVSQTRDGDLLRRIVQADFEVSGYYGLEVLADRTSETVAKQAGVFVSGVGRVESAKVTSVELVPGDKARRIKEVAKVKATFVLLSRAAA
ncbi:hypothetical protein [Micromonospora humi]|uniref:Uncharacterized protein n=1 Tax=Micromonospora humi TaxID=745366 RepID=A0A1C5KB08_9ACTN|nr:hypothetical protein [Micromonospora humi]SCG79606.1 hypothetical protein GA0070213_13313 [Micromonospora humi]